MSRRQTIFQQLVERYWATLRFGNAEDFSAAQHALADYVAKNSERVTIAGGK